MNDRFWQSLPREVDITSEDWRRHFNFWNSLPQEEIESASRFNIADLGFLLYLAGIIYLSWWLL